MTSKKLPRVILGCMTMGPPGTNAARVTTVHETKEMFKTLQSYGYTELDTARLYCDGKQEAFTRETGVLKEGFTTATKVYPTEAGMHKPAKLRQLFQTSLTELDQSFVEIFYLHAPDRTVPYEETLEEINKLHAEGKFKIFGLSNYAAWEVAQIAQICISHGWVRPRIYQGMYNALTRALEEELLPCCRHYGIDIVVYNPLAGGLFSGRYKSSSEIPTEGRFSDVEGNRSGKLYRDRYFNSVYLDAINRLAPVVEKHGLTLPETAFRWLVHHSKLRPFDGDGIIIGASSIEQLDSNLKNLQKGPLPDEVFQALDEAWYSTRAVAKTYWR
jgi:aflatoxin B1 aldehyde reductase